MVVYTYLSFPITSTPSVLIGTANIPYGSTDGVNRSIQMTVPIGFLFSIGNLSVTNGMTITITINPVSLANVYKNGTLIGTTNIVSTPNNMSSTTTKQFVLGSGVLGACSFNSYLGNIVFAYTPTTLPAFNTTDSYTFFVPFSYTITSTSSTVITSTGTNNISYGIISNTTLSTSSFNQMSYYTGSSDTTGYTAYNLWTPLAISSNWGVSNQGYIPTTNYSLWTGFYQMATLYANSAYFTNGISLKNVGSTNTIAWLDSDANGGGTIANWYASLSSLAMSFVVNSKLTNGFIFSGGNVSMSNNLTVSGNVNTSNLTATNSVNFKNGAIVQIAKGLNGANASQVQTIYFPFTFLGTPNVQLTAFDAPNYAVTVQLTSVTTTYFQYTTNYCTNKTNASPSTAMMWLAIY